MRRDHPNGIGAAPARTAPPRQRIDFDPDHVEQGLVKLVLVVVELIRRLLERQALRRIEGGRLDPSQVDKLATTMMKLEAQVKELQSHFGIDDLDIDLGPLGRVLDAQGGPAPKPPTRPD